MVQSVNTGCTLGVILWRRATYVDDIITASGQQLGIDVLAEIVDTLILESHTVEHALRGLGHAWIVVALARLQRGALHNDATNLTEIYKVLKLKTIAKCSRGGHHRIFQLECAYIYF
jgi:hypothetical protein